MCVYGFMSAPVCECLNQFCLYKFPPEVEFGLLRELAIIYSDQTGIQDNGHGDREVTKNYVRRFGDKTAQAQSYFERYFQFWISTRKRVSSDG